MIPTQESIDAAWLTARLREAGHSGATVAEFTAERVGTGQLGTCIRYTMDVAGDDGAPRTLIGKFPSDDPASRQTGVALKNYLKEVSFYREMQARLSIATPKCYFADIDGDGPDFLLLLEDMAPAEQGDQLAGCSEDVARAAVGQLVGLHAPTWCDESLRTLAWIDELGEEAAEMVRGLYSSQLEGFLGRYGGRLEADEAAIIERVGASTAVFQRPRDVFALVHVDYRLDNLLIDTSGDTPAITVVDWQSLTIGSPLADVAYFIGAGLVPETRRPVEERLVRGYHDALVAAGVGDYGWQRCWEDYRRGSFAGFFVTVVASMIVVQTDRGDEMFTAMAKRHSRHALDLGADEFLD